MNRSLDRREHLRRRSEFLKVQRQGVRIQERYITLFILPNDLNVSRLGIIATRRLGGSIRRNRSKRLVREIFRLNKSLPGFDIVVMPRPGFLDAPFSTLTVNYQAALKRHEQINQKALVKGH